MERLCKQSAVPCRCTVLTSVGKQQGMPRKLGTVVGNMAHIRRRYTVGTVCNVRPLLYVMVVKLHWEGLCMGVKLGARNGPQCRKSGTKRHMLSARLWQSCCKNSSRW